MISSFTAYAVRSAGLLLVAVFALSLFWCGDVACWSGESDGQCASLLCSLLASHAASQENRAGDCSTECMCICHMPTLPGGTFDANQRLTAQPTTFEFTAFTPSTPAASVYRPPRS